MIPILKQHDVTSEPIGFLIARNGRLLVRFTSDVKMTKDWFFTIFPGAGLLVTDWDEEVYILKGEILQFSYDISPTKDTR